MNLLAASTRGKSPGDWWRTPPVLVVAVAAALTAGASIAYEPILAAGVAFIALVALGRSREAAVSLWLTLRVLMFSGYVPFQLGEAMLALITGYALALRLVSGRGLIAPRSPVLWLMLLLLVSVNVAYFGLVPESAGYAMQIVFENFLLVILVANTKSRWRRDGAVTAVALVSVGIGLVAAVESAIGKPLILSASRIAYEPLAASHTFEGAIRLGSLLLNPDLLAAAMVLGFIVWMGIGLEDRGHLRWIALVAAVLLLCVALLTVSRTVFLGAPIGLLILFAYAITKGQVSAGTVLFAVLGLGSAILVALVLVPSAWFRITTSPTDPIRLGAAETALRIIVAHPIEGIGAGWNRYVALAEGYRVPAQYRPLAHPHNSFLEFGAMFGLPVALVIMVMIGKVLAGALPQLAPAGASSIPFAGVAAMVVMSFAGDPITIPVLSNLFWVLWAVAGQPVPELRRAAARNPTVVPDPNAPHWKIAPT